jgi:hypothetical protein
MKLFFNWIIFFSLFNVFSQEAKYPPPMIAIDSLYREDQFYIGVTYNSLFNTPSGVSQNKFSVGFTGGFLRDFPITQKRTMAIAPGIGLSYNKTFQNLYISESYQTNIYSVIPEGVNYEKNKIEELFVDIPVEFRWRTSTPESHKFWRIYTGLKLSYLVYSKYVNITYDVKNVINNNKDLNDIQFGPYVSFGYNTWNFYAYYGIIPMFKDSAQINDEEVGFNILNLGLMFYIL